MQPLEYRTADVRWLPRWSRSRRGPGQRWHIASPSSPSGTRRAAERLHPQIYLLFPLGPPPSVSGTHNFAPRKGLAHRSRDRTSSLIQRSSDILQIQAQKTGQLKAYILMPDAPTMLVGKCPLIQCKARANCIITTWHVDCCKQPYPTGSWKCRISCRQWLVLPRRIP